LQAVAFFADVPEHLICSTGFNVVEPQPSKLAPQFAYYHLLSENARQYFEAAATGVGYPAIGDKDFNAFTITLPALPEQHRIAAFLDASCASIDAAVSAKRRQLDTLNALKSSILLKALTLGLNPNVETRATGASVLPIVPVGWSFRRVKSVAEIRYGLGQPPVELSSGVAMIRATDVDAGTIRRGNFLRVDPDDLPRGRNPYLKADEIIVVRSGAYTGDSAIVPADLEGMVAGYDMVVTAKRASPRFLAYCLLSRYVLEGQIFLLTLRAAQPHLNAEELGGIQLALPPTLQEQEAIVDFVDVKFGELNRLRATIQSQIATLTAYRKSLIHECVTGQRRVTEAEVLAAV
jgi:type I restriction enzyme S subunit